MTRSTLTSGRREKLQTVFNGRPATGGVFYEATKHYLKVCKHPEAGRHPHRDAFGGIDAPVLLKLKEKDCQTVELRLSDGTVMFSLFKDMTGKGLSVNWHDRRFPRRHYLDACHWCATAQDLLQAQHRLLSQQKASDTVQALQESEQRQMSLFGGQVAHDRQIEQRFSV